MRHQTTILRKIYLDAPPLLYVEDQSDLPDWKKFWLGLLKNDELIGKSIARLDEHKKEHHCSEDGWRVFSHLLKTEYKEYYEMYKNLPEECQKVVIGNVSLRHLHHTYDPNKNCITTNREQEQENTTGDIFMFGNTSFEHIKTIYLEKEEKGEVWSYLFKQETDLNGEKRQIEVWKNHASGAIYSCKQRFC